MDVNKLRLTNFRNYGEVTAEFEPGLNLIVGGNGQGKTTLLEAIYCLSALGSHRTSTASAMVKHDEKSALVMATGRIGGSSVEATAEIVRGAGMKVWLNKQRVGRGSSHRSLTAILFSPEDLGLIKGGPEERRRFMDHAAARTRPVAVADRLDFEKALRQRNGVLKAARTSERALKQLEVWNEQLARSGAAVVKNRLEVLFGGLAESAARRYSQLATSDPPSLTYQPSWSSEEITEPREDVAGTILEALEATRARDLETASTSAGPHRDDLAIELGGTAARTFASQGEQRSLSLSLRMAERDVVERAQGEAPILLLDDVFSELDQARRDRLAELVAQSGQTIATATAAEPLPLEGGRTMRVDQGKLTTVA
ncbi:MAG: DNA replication/repair protein RecF [Actinomycetota bacterium]